MFLGENAFLTISEIIIRKKIQNFTERLLFG